jgi:hypothetical protein
MTDLTSLCAIFEEERNRRLPGKGQAGRQR